MDLKKVLEKFEKFSYKLGQEKHLLALRDGIILALPLILIGSVFIIIAAFPVQAWENYLNESGLGSLLWKIVDSTFGLMGLVAVFGIGKKMAEVHKADGIASGITAIAVYIFLMPFENGSIKIGYFGSKGLFVAIIVGIITGKLMAYLINKKIVIKMPDTVPPAVSNSFASVIPGFLVVLLFVLLNFLISLTGYNAFDIVLKLIAEPLRGLSDSYLGTIFAIGLNSLIWMFGIHGGQLVGSIMDPVWYMNTDANRIAYQMGQELPHVVTKPFLDSFVWIGGSGACIGLAIILFFFIKSSHLKAIGKVAIAPNLFGINEPMMFGIPIILNFNLVIPFFLAPIATGTLSYFAMYTGIVARTTGVMIPWATPPIISGYLSTGGSISGPILQIVNIVVTILIYLPFIKKVDNQMKKEEEINN